jgi:predicted PurR-regulated permease PerM
MKNKKDDSQQRNYAIIAIYAFIVIVAAFVAFLIINAVFNFFSEGKYAGIFSIFAPLILAFVIAYLLNPLVLLFEKKVFYKLKNKAKSVCAIILAYAVTSMAITVLAFMVIPQVAESVQQLTAMVTDLFSPYESDEYEESDEFTIHGTYIHESDEFNAQNIDIENGKHDNDNIEMESDIAISALEEAEDILSRFGTGDEFDHSRFADTKIGVTLYNFADDLQNFIDGLGITVNIKESLNDMVLSFAANLLSITMNYTSAIFNATTAIVSGIASAVLNIILGTLLSVYLLLNKDKLISQVKKLLFAVFPNNIAYKLIKTTRKIHVIFGGFITGKIVESLIVGVICFVCMVIFRFRYATLISVIVAVTNVVPFFGSIIGGVIGALFLAIVDIRQALWFGLFILVLQQFDGNILGPKILGSKLGMSSFWVIVAVIVMSGFLGLPGIFIGVPVFAVMYVLIKEFAEYRLEKKGFPVETKYYSHNLGTLEENIDNIENSESFSIFSMAGKIAKNISAKLENRKANKPDNKSGKNDKDYK